MVRKRTVAAAALIGIMVLVGGFASYQLGASRADGKFGEDIPLGGYVVIDAYHANGQLFATWSGHNSLYQWAVSAIADCMSGQGSSPEGFNTCSGLTPNVWAYNGGSEPVVSATATNSLLPVGCSTTANPPTCTGWQTTGTITFAASTPTGITYPYSVNQGGAAAIESYIPFDTVSISPPITANAGDSLVITVTFSIT